MIARSILIVCNLLEAGILVSLLLTGTWKASKAFIAYMIAVAIPDVLFWIWPPSYTWNFWAIKELAHCVIKMALALELTVLVFAGLPRARATAQWALALILYGTLARMLLARFDGLYGSFTEWLAIGDNGMAFAFCAIFVLATWYRVPMHPLHRAVLGGLTVYNLVLGTALSILGDMGWTNVSRNMGALTYALVLVYWLSAAWQHETIPEGAPLRVLRPWA